jgi:hypothetical protein
VLTSGQYPDILKVSNEREMVLMTTLKTEWMEMYDGMSRFSLRAELESIDGLMEVHLAAGNEREPIMDELLAKYDYIYQIIGDYSEMRLYLRGDESGELITKTFETESHRNRWVEGMGDSIEIFSENIY